MRKINIIYLTFIFILISNLSKAQSSFYETDSLKEIRIYFYEPNWQSTLDSLYIIGNDELAVIDPGPLVDSHISSLLKL